MMATLIASLSSSSPQDEIGIALIQAPQYMRNPCGQETGFTHIFHTIISKPSLSEASSCDFCLVCFNNHVNYFYLFILFI